MDKDMWQTSYQLDAGHFNVDTGHYVVCDDILNRNGWKSGGKDMATTKMTTDGVDLTKLNRKKLIAVAWGMNEYTKELESTASKNADVINALALELIRIGKGVFNIGDIVRHKASRRTYVLVDFTPSKSEFMDAPIQYRLKVDAKSDGRHDQTVSRFYIEEIELVEGGE